MGLMKPFRFSLRLPKGRDIWIQSSMLLLALVGLLMITSASMSTNVVPLTLLMIGIKQSAFIVIGYFAYLICINNFKLEWVAQHIVTIMGVTLVMLLVPLLYPKVSGANAWIVIPGIDATIQPSEFAKIVVVLVLAVYLGDNKTRKMSAYNILKMPLFFTLTVFIEVWLFQNDTGTALVIFAMAYGVFMLSGHPKFAKYQWRLFWLTLIGLIAVTFIMTPTGINFLRMTGIFAPYQIDRFENTLNPFLNKYGSGYQLVSSLVAFVRGKWFGVGYGMGLQKYGYLPAAKTDFILAVIAEETGFAGIILVVGLFAILVYRLMFHAIKATSEKNRMILVGVALYISVHFILNVGGVTALIPLTGVPLLLLSSGGSSTLALMTSLGIAQAIIVTQSKEIASQP